jgi:hypothetical protein
MTSIYDVGTRAWQPDAAEGWVASECTAKTPEGDKVKLVFKLENGEVWTLQMVCGSFVTLDTDPLLALGERSGDDRSCPQGGQRP